MALHAGDRVGPYEILGGLGAGGMGEVYRARDPRLGRTVAVKMLPGSVSLDPSRRQRFEHEARTTGLLNHPNIVVVYDVGNHDGAPYLVTELLEGETLRERLGAGAIPPRKAVDYALQVAHGLAAAHDKAVVHRDLKPENLFLTKDGVVKILDFGLALHEAMTDRGDTRSLTRETGPGVVLGTVGYMAPEQARGDTADHRADIFALGAVLYEMLSGRRAFREDTAVETLNAILKQEPEEFTPELKVPPSLDRVVRHCLEKKREDRFQSARDVAFALETLGSVSQSTATVAPLRRRRWLPVVAAAVAAAAFTALGLLAGRLLWEKPQPTFKPLTFGRGWADFARFAPDGRTVVYGAAWDGEPPELFMTRTDSAESRPLGLKFARVLSISGDGRMLVLLDPTRGGGYFNWGTLAEVPLTGGVPREILESVIGGEWTPDGREMCVAHQTREGYRIELPPGQVLYASNAFLGFLRLAPTGSHVAFSEGGQVVVVDRVTRERRVLVEKPPSNLYGLAWAPDGREVWYTAGPTVGARDILAVDLRGRQRVVYRSAGVVSLLDVRPDGHALLHRAYDRLGIVIRFAGEGSDREMTVSGGSAVAGFSADGRTVLLYTRGAGYAGDPVGGRVTYVRRQGEPEPIRIAEGLGMDLSPDGGSALVLRKDGLYDVPVGAGLPRRIDLGGIAPFDARFVPPDATRIVVRGRRDGSGAWFWLVPRAGGPGRPLGPETHTYLGGMAVGPQFVAATSVPGALTLVPLDGGPAREVEGLSLNSAPRSFNSEDGSLFLSQYPCELSTLNPSTGKVRLFRKLGPADRTAVLQCGVTRLRTDGSTPTRTTAPRRT